MINPKSKLYLSSATHDWLIIEDGGDGKTLAVCSKSYDPLAEEIVRRWNAHVDQLEALEKIVEEWEDNEIGQLDETFIDLARAAITKSNS